MLQGDANHALRAPLYDSVSFGFESAADISSAFQGRLRAHSYSRLSNPTVEVYENTMRDLTGAPGVLAVSSGMAAIADVVVSLAEAGSNIVASRNLFSHTRSLFSDTFGRWGLETRYVDMTSSDEIIRHIDTRTRLLFLEVISNPQLEVADIPEICGIAAERNVPVVLDGTLTSGYLFDSKAAGVAVEIVSSTKFISGGATAVGGLILDNGVFDWKRHPALSDLYRRAGPGALLYRLRGEVYRNIGTCPAPHTAWLHSLGLETLALRADKSCRNALTVASFLEERKEISSVNYPGLTSSKSYPVARSLLKRGYGGVLTFDLSDRDAAFRFIDALGMIQRATNLSDNKTLIIHPASTIFAEMSTAERQAIGIRDGMLRLSVGIEDAEDILNDLNRGIGVL